MPNKRYRWNPGDARWELWDGMAWVRSALLAHLNGDQAALVKPYGVVVEFDPNERVRQWP